MNDDLGWTKECVARHLGLWAAEPLWLSRAAAAMKLGLYQVPPRKWAAKGGMVSREIILSIDQNPLAMAALPSSKPYPLQGGVAVIPIQGPMLKGEGKNGEANTLAVRRAVRAAARDEEVGAILLAIDSPGGVVEGTEELAADVRNARAAKPVFAHIDDLVASAAYWVASQAQRITANSAAEVGSIGVLSVVEDLSKMAEADGIQVHVVSTGPYKGAFTPGAPVPEEHLAYLQERVNDIHGLFLRAVAQGRGVGGKVVQGWADGRVFPAAQAKEMGMVDGVMLFDQAMALAQKAVPRRAAKAQAQIARAQLRQAEAEQGGLDDLVEDL